MLGDITFTHPLEEHLARSLHEASKNTPVGSSILQGDIFQNVAAALKHYLPAVLSEVHDFWKHESLDGVLPQIAMKTSVRQAEIAGHCILITDQGLTPFHVQLRFTPEADKIEWLDCRLGEMREGKLLRVPYNSSHGEPWIADRLSSISWLFHVGFGDPTV